MVTLADELARQQRSISVAEFFEKNKHLLGFDSPTRGIITTIKEAVDNALDACEEAMVLPDVFVGIKRTESDVFRITVEDNGPGIIPAQVPFVFGKLLYGSRFHQIRQSRGQQGIGISAAVLYAQLTTGLPTLVISRTGPDYPASRFLLQINIKTNEPEVVEQTEVEWDRTHGTRVQIEFKSSMAAKKRLLEYLKYTSVVNPHARIRVELDDETYLFERVSDEVIACPQAIKPHPHGIEIGQLMRMLGTAGGTCGEFLVENFTRVGKKTAEEICRNAGISPAIPAVSLSPAEQKKLLGAMQGAKVPAPPTQTCLSPIGEELIARGLEKEFQMDFVRSRTRPSSVYSGHPFLVEAAIGYGGKLPPDGNAQILRFANRVPLLYQQGACAITGCVAGVSWKNYNVSQAGLPTGPLLILVHVASTHVPFTSESKDAIAAIPEIEREVTLVLQELGRELKTYLSRRDKNRLQEDRARAVCSIIPEIAVKVAEIVDLPVPDTSAIEGRIMRKVVVKKMSRDGRVRLEVKNYTSQPGALTIYDISRDSGEGADPKPAIVTELDGEHTKVWQVEIDPGGSWSAEYRGAGGGSLEVRGMPPEHVVVVDLDAQ
ncbi:MAG: Type 2 DNA topoisomerase 6 subunit B [Methanoregulaceae archaeon PtaB.Bin152]|nr:MAG: Type 2 DNA topoisomerase 6 subunit B [Methanoregulaceae archaeon PtaB.Bin152]